MDKRIICTKRKCENAIGMIQLIEDFPFDSAECEAIILIVTEKQCKDMTDWKKCPHLLPTIPAGYFCDAPETHECTMEDCPCWTAVIKIRNKQELIEALKERAKSGDVVALALAYIVNDVCPEDRTGKHVFRKRK